MSSQSTHPLGLPTSPNLEYYRKRARALLSGSRAGDTLALARLRAATPRFDLVPSPQLAQQVKLADAQFAIARENGFLTWARMKRTIESGSNGRFCRPFVKDVEYYADRAGGLLSVFQTGTLRALQQIRANHPDYAGSSDEAIRSAKLLPEDVLLVTARQHGFAGWDQLCTHIEAMKAGTAQEPFEEAFQALKQHRPEELHRLLKDHPELVNAQGTNGNTLLNLAASFRRLDMTRMLLEAGADVDLANFKGATSLHQAAYSNQTDLAQILLAAGASPEMEAYGEGGTPLMMALFWGNREVAELLATQGVLPRNLRAAAGVGDLEMVRGFFNADGSLKPEAGLRREFHRPHSGFPPWVPTDTRQEILDDAFVYAAKSGRVEVMRLLANQGADLNGEPYNGTALQWAASRGHVPTVDLLLDAGAEIDRPGNFGGVATITPLITAAWGGNTEGVAQLLRRGADPTYREPAYHATAAGFADHHGHTATRDYILAHAKLDLLDAIRFNQLDRVRELLAGDPGSANRPLYEVDPAAEQDMDCALPIYRAVRSGNVEAVRLLLEAGAEPSPAQREHGKTPLQLAEETGNAEIAALLEKRE